MNCCQGGDSLLKEGKYIKLRFFDTFLSGFGRNMFNSFELTVGNFSSHRGGNTIDKFNEKTQIP